MAHLPPQQINVEGKPVITNKIKFQSILKQLKLLKINNLKL